VKKSNIKDVNLLYLIDVACIILGFTALVTLLGLICIPFSGMGIDYDKVTNAFITLVNENQILAMIISQGLLLMPIVIFALNRKDIIFNIIRFNSIDIRTIISLIVLTYTLMPVMTFINMLSMLFVDNKISSTIDSVVHNNSMISALLCIAMLPAFVEEVLCRGVIYNVHRKVSIKKAVIINGLLFGLLHCNFNQFAYAFFMGIVFSLVVEATNSTLSTILMHFIVNANSMVLAYIAEITGENVTFEEEISYTVPQVASWGIFAVFALAISILLYRELAKNNNTWELIKSEFKVRKNVKNTTLYIEETQLKKESDGETIFSNADAENDDKVKVEDRIVDIYLVIAMIVCLVYMICVEIM